MKLTSLNKLCFLFFLFTILSFASVRAQLEEEFNFSKYVNSINKARKIKNIEMKNGERSPIPDDARSNFKGLNYFRPKVSYRKEVYFKRFDQATRFLMKTTTERLPEYSLYGIISFRHRGKNYSLNVYQNIELMKKPGYENHLFIPFSDETNGTKTYSGGRFLDMTENGSDRFVVDFNKAYNPYCAYDHKYSCPIPPKENSLNIKINAGEKKWQK